MSKPSRHSAKPPSPLWPRFVDGSVESRRLMALLLGLNDDPMSNISIIFRARAICVGLSDYRVHIKAAYLAHSQAGRLAAADQIKRSFPECITEGFLHEIGKNDFKA